MKRTLLSLLLLLGGWQAIQAQQRYIDNMFTGYDVQRKTYGMNVNVAGRTDTLFADFYLPKGDVEKSRPILIFAHGGSFIGGDLTQNEVTQFAKAYALKGYVTASIKYRLGVDFVAFSSGKQKEELFKAAVRAVQDGKALVRYLRKSVATENNPFGIDTSRIVFGGSSAGAILSMHLAYLHSRDEFKEVTDPALLDKLGGIEGESGNPGYSAKIKAVINLCGALGKAHWVNSGDVPIISLHGTSDNTVPYKYGNAAGSVPVEGSYLVDSAARAAGVKSYLKTWPGQDHVPYASSPAYRDSTITFITPRLYEILFGPVGMEKQSIESVKIYPNPAQSQFTVQLPSDMSLQYELLNLNGNAVLRGAIHNSSELVIPRGNLAAGLYILKASNEKQQLTQKVMFE